ncbi:MAG: metal ABC transporter ATP-binding protein [Anaerolineales bacterium]
MPESTSRHLLYPNTQHDANQPILAFEQVSARYDGRLAIENITFRLQRGERIAVVGPNGAGKSTLFKVITGILAPSAGNVRIFGSEPAGHVCIGYVPQRSQVDWRFPVTVYDVVMMGRIARVGAFRLPGKRDRDTVQRALAMVNLQSLAKRQIAQLSGGQQQRMFIARAIAQEAELMLMDEPLNGLDIPSQEDILHLLDVLREQQITVMVATHDLDQAAEHFDRVMLLNRHVIGFGAPAQILSGDNLRHAYGSHLRLLPTNGGELLALGDTCCDGEHEQ